MKAEKQLLKQEIKDKIIRYGDSFIILRNGGLEANAANDFRREMRERGGNVYVMRKRVLAKAAEDLDMKLDVAALQGHIGLVFLGNNPLDNAKAVFNFGKAKNNIIEVLGLRYEGQLYLGADAKEIAELPSKDEMRAQLLSVLEAPMAQTLAVLDAVLSSVIYCLDNKSKSE
jgi:large subunit ribosomal protein L10